MRNFLFILLIYSIPFLTFGQQVDMDIFHGMTPRNIGPAGMSGRVTCIEVNLSDPDQIYIGTAAGGVWKSNNSGHTWMPIFDDQIAASIGDIAIYQKNPSIIYVGSGEGNPRNSQNSGRGMFKSIDGGMTWQHLGLENSRQIHRVIVHPYNENIVWAGVSGATWGESDERGVYKSIDGGNSWNKVLYTNETTGVADLVMDPSNPNKLIAAMWEHRRWPWFFKSGGSGSSLQITYDGGETWKKIGPSNGLPEGDLGRIGLSFAPSAPNIIYAYIECEENAIYRSEDGGENWKKVSKKGQAIGGRPFYYADIYVDTKNENRLYSIASTVTVSEDGGQIWSTFAPGNRIHTDHHAWWSHPDDPEYIIIGHDGGLNITHDMGEKWWFADNLPLAQFYHIRVDNEFPYNVMGGLQDNGSWRGPSRTWFKGGIRNMYWQRLSVGDGFDVVPDPINPDYGYAMGQAGNLIRYHTQSGHLKRIKPVHPDGEYLRFNWNAGIAIDPHDQKTVYYGSQYLHKSEDYGNSWEIISPDLTTDDTSKKDIKSGGLTYDVTGAEFHCTIISIDPSPVERDIIWVGTDDGNVQVTTDGGTTWNNVTNNIAGVPQASWVTQITASIHDAATAFVVFDDHRRNNWEPYIYMTEDLGKTWKRLADQSDFDGFAYSFVQDPQEPNLMFAGTEFGFYASFDGGSNWNKWTQNFPTTPVTDMVIHPREHDLVIGTFGRAIWILDDIRPLRAVASMGLESISDQDLYLFDPPDEHLMIIGESKGWRQGKIGDALYNGENRKEGALLSYYTASDSEIKIQISDSDGNAVRRLKHQSKSGFNRINWLIDMNRQRSPNTEKPDSDAIPRGGFYAPPGVYTIEISTSDDTSTQDIIISPDPRLETDPNQISLKVEQYKSYDYTVAQATKVMDELRDYEKNLGIIKGILERQELPENDSVHAQLDTLLVSLSTFKKLVIGEQVQGILRDPDVITSKMFSVRYALDHTLSPASANQDLQLRLLKDDVDRIETDWVDLREKIKSEVREVQSKYPLDLFEK